MILNRRSFLLASMANAVVASLPSAPKAQTGRRLGKLREITDAMPPRQFMNVPGTSLRPVIPAESAIPDGGAQTGPASVLSAWNGAAYDEGGQRLFL